MARKIKRSDVIKLIEDAGQEGVPKDARVVMRMLRQDGDPRELRRLLDDIVDTRQVHCESMRAQDGKFRTVLFV